MCEHTVPRCTPRLAHRTQLPMPHAVLPPHWKIRIARIAHIARIAGGYGADALCKDGLWYFSRHANYLGEIYFQTGVLIAGLAASSASGALRLALPRAYLSLLAPLTFISIMLASTRGLEARQLEAYAGKLHTCGECTCG